MGQNEGADSRLAKMKECPVCGQQVGLHKLESHLKKVHPRDKVEVKLDAEERKEVRKKAAKAPARPRGKWIALIAVIVVIVVVLAVVLVPRGLKVGDVPPDFELPDIYGAHWSLDTFKSYNKPILIEFMHPQCDACISVAPVLASFYDDYQVNITMVSIAITLEHPGWTNPPTVAQIVKFKQDHSTDFTYLLDRGTEVRGKYGVDSTPTFFLVRKDGRIGWIYLGAMYYDELRDAMLPFF